MTRSFITSVLVSVLVLLSACRTDPATTTDAPVQKFAANNTLTIATLGDADKLNPIFFAIGVSNDVLCNIFQFLEYSDPETLELSPQLAKARPVVEDIVEDGEVVASKYTFELREEARWPNGTPVTAEDYAFSLKVVFNPKMPNRFGSVLGTTFAKLELYPDNPRKFTVYTQERYILNEEGIAATLAVMPAYYYDPAGLMTDIDVNDLLDKEKATALAEQEPKLEEFAELFSSPKYSQNPVGSAAYELKEWETGVQIILERKKDWWGNNVANPNVFFNADIDQLIYKAIPDLNTANNAMKSASIDLRADIDPQSYKDLQENELTKDVYNFHSVPRLVYYFLYLNNKDVRMTDKRVRQALAHLIDVDDIIDVVYDGMPQRIIGPLPTTHKAYRSDLPQIPYNVEKAKTLFADAGWADTNNNGIVDKMIDGELVEMKLEILIAAGRETQQSLALLFKEAAIKGGVEVEITSKEGREMGELIRSRNYQIASAGSRSAPIAWEPKSRWHSESDSPQGFNRTGINNSELDALIDEARVTIDEKKRNELYRQIQGILYDEQTAIFLFAANNQIAIHKRFEAELSILRPNYSIYRTKQNPDLVE